MSTFSIHLEKGKFVVRDGYIACMDEKWEKHEAPELKGDEGAKVGTYASREAAAAKVAELDAEERREAKIAAAKELLATA